MQSFVVYYFEQMYKMVNTLLCSSFSFSHFNCLWFQDTSLLGLLMMGANTLAGISALLATPLVKKIGGINTMVVTHFPSNIFLFLVPVLFDLIVLLWFDCVVDVVCRRFR